MSQSIPRITQAMFTLYRIVKRNVAESVPDTHRASVHTRNTALEAFSAPVLLRSTHDSFTHLLSV